MGSFLLQRGGWVLVGVFLFSYICGVKASNTYEGSVLVDGKAPIAITSENFVCATLDWWPPDKCDYGTCSWDHASVLNLDLNNSILLKAVKAFKPLLLRMGGSLQDRVIYQMEGNQQPCTPFVMSNSLLFSYTTGCLSLARWDELNAFVNKSKAHVFFGLNALNGRTIHPNSTATGPWNSTNAASFLRYTVEKGYKIYGWEYGNELSGMGIIVRVDADTYASDTIHLHKLMQRIYKRVHPKPKIISPGGLWDPIWYGEYIPKTNGSVNAISHHIYNIGPGNDTNLVARILNASVLDSSSSVLSSVQNLVQNYSKTVSAWVSEAGGVYNSGRDGISNRYVNSFWYLDQLGLASTYNHKVYCRQTLIGGNYGLLNTTTFAPNPDYYSALLWHRLMGSRVLRTTFNGSKTIRAYAHCATQSPGITILLINLDANMTLEAKTEFVGTKLSHHRHDMMRKEYHLTPLDGYIQSQTVLLNGKVLTIGSLNYIPDAYAVMANSSEPIRVAPLSIVFVHMPTVVIPACR